MKSHNVYLKQKDSAYKFINCVLQQTDGSFYVSLMRSGETEESVLYDNVDYLPKILKNEKPKKKLKKISYHSSGCVRYHNTEFKSNYFEPITRLTRPNTFVAWSIPSLSKLEKVDLVTEEDFVIQIDSGDSRLQFSFSLAPWNTVVEQPHFSIRYEGFFCLIIVPDPSKMREVSGLENHFMTIAPNEGLFLEQAMKEDLSLIEYHQKINDSRELIIYSPNGEGIYTIITRVPMRIAPDVVVKFADDNYIAEVVSRKNNMIKFKVKNQYGHTLKKEIPIVRIELSAEL